MKDLKGHKKKPVLLSDKVKIKWHKKSLLCKWLCSCDQFHGVLWTKC